MKINRGQKSFILIFLLLLTVSLLAFNYIFTIYEVTTVSEPEQIIAGANSYVKISLIPVNALGYKAPFRNAGGKFTIAEGNDFIEVVSVNEEKGAIVLKSVGVPGLVSVRIESEYSLFPIVVEIQILDKSV